jgi:hypothetical protein
MLQMQCTSHTTRLARRPQINKPRKAAAGKDGLLSQGAAKLHIDSLTLYAAGNGQLNQGTPTIDLAAASTALSGTAANTGITLPRDGTVLTGAAEELVLTYHFGAT